MATAAHEFRLAVRTARAILRLILGAIAACAVAGVVIAILRLIFGTTALMMHLQVAFDLCGAIGSLWRLWMLSEIATLIPAAFANRLKDASRERKSHSCLTNNGFGTARHCDVYLQPSSAEEQPNHAES